VTTSPRTQLYKRSAVAIVGLTALFVGVSWDSIAGPASDSSGTEVCSACRRAADIPSPPPEPYDLNASRFDAELARVPEVSLIPPGSHERLFRERGGNGEHPVLALFDSRPDFRGLPVLRDEDCHGLACVAAVARTLRPTLGETVQFLSTRAGSRLRRADDMPTWVRRDPARIAEAHPMLLWQMCQCEKDDLRGVMTDVLKILEKPAAIEGLTRIALYDPDSDLRQKAVIALKSRPAEESRPYLIEGFAHPMSCVADHAATALTLLNDRGAVPELIDLLGKPDPNAPIPDESGTPVVHELVKINHARNCQMCHAPSWDTNEVARATVPSPDQPLTPSFSSDYNNPCSDIFVRIDVTYLRPDFSRMLPVAKAAPWPDRQRYDFLVRTRPATPAEIIAPRPEKTPQREAIVRALQRLTGESLGDDVAAWKLVAARNLSVKN
jgi:hypothetical protein